MRKFLILSFLLLFTVFGFITTSQATTYKRSEYQIRLLPDKTAMIVNYIGDYSNLKSKEYHLVLPSVLETTKGNYPITSIADNAFEAIVVSKQQYSWWTSYSYGGTAYIKSITVPDSITKIGSSAFLNCQNLESIHLSDNIKEIGYRTFSGCISLKKVVLPKSLIEIEGRLFKSCSSLQDVKIPEGVTSIGSEAFWGCDELSSINLPSTITSIGNSAFGLCKKLTSVVLPDDLTHLSDNMFSGCESLQSIALPKNLLSVGVSVFDEISKSAVFQVDQDSEFALDYIDQNELAYKIK